MFILTVFIRTIFSYLILLPTQLIHIHTHIHTHIHIHRQIIIAIAKSNLSTAEIKSNLSTAEIKSKATLDGSTNNEQIKIGATKYQKPQHHISGCINLAINYNCDFFSIRCKMTRDPQIVSIQPKSQTQ